MVNIVALLHMTLHLNIVFPEVWWHGSRRSHTCAMVSTFKLYVDSKYSCPIIEDVVYVYIRRTIGKRYEIGESIVLKVDCFRITLAEHCSLLQHQKEDRQIMTWIWTTKPTQGEWYQIRE